MSISTTLVKFIEQLSAAAENNYRHYNKASDDLNLLPNDAIYMMRIMNLKSVCDLIEELANKSGKDPREVIEKSILPNKTAIGEMYKMTGTALDRICDFSIPTHPYR